MINILTRVAGNICVNEIRAQIERIIIKKIRIKNVEELDDSFDVTDKCEIIRSIRSKLQFQGNVNLRLFVEVTRLIIAIKECNAHNRPV